MTGKPIEPIFIFSCERSGSTLLRFIMDTHPSVCCSGQLYLGPLCQSLYTSAFYSIAQLKKDSTESEKELVAIEEARRIVSDMLERYTHEKGKNRWCEKTTLNIDYLSILSKIFPESKFICLYRNCLDVISSCIEHSSWGFMSELTPYVKKNPDNFIAAMAESWLEKNQKLLAFEQLHQDRCFRLTYESLVTEPDGIVSSLFKFLDLEWDDQLLDRVFTAHHDHGDGDSRILFAKKISQDSVGKGRRIPLSNLPEDLSEKVNNLHNVLGYQSIQTLHTAKINNTDPASQANENAGEKEPDLSRFFESKVTEIVKNKQDEFRFLNSICLFVIPGAEAEMWLLDTMGKSVTFRKGETNDADCSITLSYQAFYDLFRGDKNPVDAYRQKEIHVDGDIETAVRYGKLLLGGQALN